MTPSAKPNPFGFDIHAFTHGRSRSRIGRLSSDLRIQPNLAVAAWASLSHVYRFILILLAAESAKPYGSDSLSARLGTKQIFEARLATMASTAICSPFDAGA